MQHPLMNRSCLMRCLPDIQAARIRGEFDKNKAAVRND